MPPAITSYTLCVFGPTSESPTAGGVAFNSKLAFVTSSTPFMVPHVGDEIVLDLDGSDALPPPPDGHMYRVTRACHVVKVANGTLTCEVQVFTDLAART